MSAEAARRASPRRRLAILGCRGIPARYGGFETFAEELGTRLVERGFEVTVYCAATGSAAMGSAATGSAAMGSAATGSAAMGSAATGDAATEEGQAPARHRGVGLEYVRVPRLGPLSALYYDLRALRHARRSHEVVYMLGYGAGAFLGLGRRPGNEVWVNMDGLEWRRAKWGWLARTWLCRMERAALRAADRVVFDSAAVQQAVCARAPAGSLEGGRAFVIEYGARLDLAPDVGVVQSLGLAPLGYFVLVARIEPENHVREILTAHARAGVPQELLVVGDVERAGRYGAACRAAAGPRARFLGPVFDAHTLFALRHASRAALHGHSVGGTNPALLEAMAAGAPVLAHDNPFNREVLETRGIFFREVQDLAQALVSAAGWSPEERARRGAENRARVEARYGWERVAAAYAARLGEPAPAAHPPDPSAPLPSGRDASWVATREPRR